LSENIVAERDRIGKPRILSRLHLVASDHAYRQLIADAAMVERDAGRIESLSPGTSLARAEMVFKRHT
jgi:hypothetical protein